MGLKFRIFIKAEYNSMSAASALRKATAASAPATPATPATPANATAAKLLPEKKAGAHNAPEHFDSEGGKVRGCRGKGDGKGGDRSEINDLRKEVQGLKKVITDGFAKQSSETLKLSEVVEKGFADHAAADERMQLAIREMMGGIGALASTIQTGMSSSRSAPLALHEPPRSQRLALPPPAEVHETRYRRDQSFSESACARVGGGSVQNVFTYEELLKTVPSNSQFFRLLKGIERSAKDGIVSCFLLHNLTTAWNMSNQNVDLACALMFLLRGQKLSSQRLSNVDQIRGHLTNGRHRQLFQQFFKTIASYDKAFVLKFSWDNGTPASYPYLTLSSDTDLLEHYIEHICR